MIVVYGLFLSNLQVDRIQESVGEINGISWLVNSWLVAGLLTVSTFTVPLNILSNMVVDQEKNVFDDFYVAPIKRSSIVFGYALSAFIIDYDNVDISIWRNCSYYTRWRMVINN